MKSEGAVPFFATILQGGAGLQMQVDAYKEFSDGPVSSGGWSVNTGQELSRTTFSATDPKIIRLKPVSPCVEITIISTSSSSANRVMLSPGRPVTASDRVDTFLQMCFSMRSFKDFSANFCISPK